jgi:hypothetical protein
VKVFEIGFVLVKQKEIGKYRKKKRKAHPACNVNVDGDQ